MAQDQPSESVARLVRWVIFGVLLYAIWSSFHGSAPKPPAPVAAASVIKEKDCDDVNPLKNFSLLAVPLLPAVIPSVHVQDIKEGKGEPAQCGHLPKLPSSAQPLRIINSQLNAGEPVQCGDKVRVALTVWKMDGTKLYSTDNTPLTLTLGLEQVPYGITQGILGMTQGGRRTLIMPPAYNKILSPSSADAALRPLLAIDSKETVLVEIELLPALQESPSVKK